MIFEFEVTTAFGVNAKEVISLLQDPERFMMAGGGSLEGSIRYDENEGLWHAQSKDSIPMLSKPTYTARMSKTERGAIWTVETKIGGIKSVHTWVVNSIADQECTATESVKVYATLFSYMPVKYTFPKAQRRAHKSLQKYLS